MRTKYFPPGQGMPSPWGSVQTSIKYCTGLHYVTTASHGGFMVGKNWAKENLSADCRSYGDSFGNFLCYEEDCAYVLIEYELINQDTNWHVLFNKDRVIPVTLEYRWAAHQESLRKYYPRYAQDRNFLLDNIPYAGHASYIRGCPCRACSLIRQG